MCLQVQVGKGVDVGIRLDLRRRSFLYNHPVFTTIYKQLLYILLSLLSELVLAFSYQDVLSLVYHRCLEYCIAP